jgi:hypothetical protein
MRMAAEVLRVDGPEGSLEFIEEELDGGERRGGLGLDGASLGRG